jgi:hypothetical protein
LLFERCLIVSGVDAETDALHETGRGLQLVGAVAVRWGTELADDGKTVWVELG